MFRAHISRIKRSEDVVQANALYGECCFIIEMLRSVVAQCYSALPQLCCVVII